MKFETLLDALAGVKANLLVYTLADKLADVEVKTLA